jgi:hypothetical protein
MLSQLLATLTETNSIFGMASLTLTIKMEEISSSDSLE